MVGVAQGMLEAGAAGEGDRRALLGRFWGGCEVERGWARRAPLVPHPRPAGKEED